MEEMEEEEEKKGGERRGGGGGGREGVGGVGAESGTRYGGGNRSVGR